MLCWSHILSSLAVTIPAVEAGMEARRMGLESEDRLTCPLILSHLGFYQQNNLQIQLDHHFLKLELRCLEQSKNEQFRNNFMVNNVT